MNNSALMDSLIFDYFAQGLNSREDASDGGRESTESEERQGEKQQHEIEGTPYVLYIHLLRFFSIFTFTLFLFYKHFSFHLSSSRTNKALVDRALRR